MLNGAESWSGTDDEQPPQSGQSWLDEWPPPPPPLEQPWADPRPLRLIPRQAEPPPIPAPPSAAELESMSPVRQAGTSDLDAELEAAREELEALHDIFEDLPAIFERKFQQRLQGVLQQQQRLLAENQGLRRQLAILPPGMAPAAGRTSPRLLLPPAQESRSGLAQTLRNVIRRDREDDLNQADAAESGAATGRPQPPGRTPGDQQPQKPITPDDDGQPRAA